MQTLSDWDLRIFEAGNIARDRRDVRYRIDPRAISLSEQIPTQLFEAPRILWCLFPFVFQGSGHQDSFDW